MHRRHRYIGNIINLQEQSNDIEMAQECNMLNILLIETNTTGRNKIGKHVPRINQRRRVVLKTLQLCCGTSDDGYTV